MFSSANRTPEYLSFLGFSWSAIAALLGVSHMTIYRRRQEYGLLSDPQNTLSGQDLVTVLSHLRHEYPNIGETMVYWSHMGNGL